jgi:hypothetical protein
VDVESFELVELVTVFTLKLVLVEVVLIVLVKVVLLVLGEGVKLVVVARFSNSTRFRLSSSFKGVPGPGAARDCGTIAEADKAARESTANIRVDFMIVEIQSNCRI